MRLSPSIAILRTQSDERLVELARDGSESAFAAIVERYRRPMLRGCRRVLPESRAEDAVQQAFISAWRALERGDAVTDLHAWLMRIARNTALNALRVSGYDYDELRDSLRGSEAPQGELERRDVVRQTLAGLAALPERQREALMRSALEGASHAEIAKALGLSEGATRQLVLRARATMRSAATALTPGPIIGWAAWTGRGAPSGEFVQRIAELSAGGGAGAGALLAKASLVTVVAGSVVVGPSVVHRAPERAKAESVPARSSAARAASQPSGFFAPASASSSGSAQHASSGSGGKASSSGSGKSDSGKDSSGSSSSGEDGGSSQQGSGDSSGPGSGTSDESDNSGPGSGSSGSGSSGSDDGGSDESGSSGSGSGSSGSGSGTSGSDDGGSSGSGSSGSGSSGGESGSGSSGSSGSGSSGGDDTKPDEPDSSGKGSGKDGAKSADAPASDVSRLDG